MHTNSSTMPFGKYKGRPFCDLPSDYLHWLANLDDLLEPVRSYVFAEVRRRSQPHGDPWRARRRREAHPPDPPHRRGPVDGDVAAAIIEAGRRALAAKNHPDVGGDLKAMQSINATADKLLGQFPRRRSAA